MVNYALLIAYHYPPVKGSSGVHRTLAFSRYLPENNWQPIVLTAHSRAYESISDEQMHTIPNELIIQRAFALDTKRHFAVCGKYPTLLATPDRWISWWIGGVLSGLRLIRKYRPGIIWSTYPIATAHLIGLTLHNLTGLPWIADFRDSMIDDSFPHDPYLRKVHLAIERRVVNASSRVLFTTYGAVDIYRERYPDLPNEKLNCLENGYDEEAFFQAEQRIHARDTGKHKNSPMILVHSGVIYPSERNPECFFNAISTLKEQGKLEAKAFSIVLRATGHDEYYQAMIERMNLEDIVKLEPAITYSDALKEMIMADGLLIFQAANCNHQVPAKLYEYFRAKRPVFAMTDPAGDTAHELKRAGYTHIAQLDNSEMIGAELMRFIGSIMAGSSPIISDELLPGYSRRIQTRKLASFFNDSTGRQFDADQ